MIVGAVLWISVGNDPFISAFTIRVLSRVSFLLLAISGFSLEITYFLSRFVIKNE